MDQFFVNQEIKRILINDLGVSASLVAECKPQTPLLGRGIGIDSMETLTLTVGLEEAFDIQIDDEELSEALFQTVGSLVRFVSKKIGKHSGG